jgi:hypothetical protein
LRLLVIGGSDAGISAGLRARELDPTVEVSLLVADAYPTSALTLECTPGFTLRSRHSPYS